MNQWTKQTDACQSLLNQLREIGSRKGYVINADAERVDKVVGLMTENLVASGGRYCPCKQSHPLDPQKDVVCPCPSWEEEIARDGHCFCRLFFRKSEPDA